MEINLLKICKSHSEQIDAYNILGCKANCLDLVTLCLCQFCWRINFNRQDRNTDHREAVQVVGSCLCEHRIYEVLFIHEAGTFESIMNDSRIRNDARK